ncbi:MAG: DUF192 domain-containing protein [archaeon]
MIKNITNKKTLANNKKLCKSSWEQGLGLMFSKKKEDYALIFEFDKKRKVSLHMFFVFYPIDVISLDEKKRVVDIKSDFKPFTFHTAKKKVKYIIELPRGIVKKTKTKIGDLINF